jgi:hypothetical protein
VREAYEEAADRANSHRVLGSFPRAAQPPRTRLEAEAP